MQFKRSSVAPAQRPSAGSSAGFPQAAILRGAADGEPWAHAALYDALYPVVARALQKILHQTRDYEDLVQTSFELIVRTLHGPQGRRIENLAAWASTIAARVALDALRVRVRERRFFDRDAAAARAAEAAPGPALERELSARDDLAWLQRTLAEMSSEQAEAVVLHDVLGYELAEIAVITEVSSAAAQKRLSRGHLELRRRAERRAKEGTA